MTQSVIKRFGVLSCAKLYGVVLAVIGLIAGIIYAFAALVFGAFAFSQNSGNGAAFASGAVVAVLAVILIPVFYGILGFLMGALSAFIYNIAAGVLGGIELDLENKPG